MAKNITFFLWGALETACWFLVAMYPPSIYPVVSLAIVVGVLSTVAIIILGIFYIVDHWNN
jgi:hypothetical protein